MKKTILLVFIILMLVLSSCGFPVRTTTVRGTGNIVTESRRVSGINSVELSGVGTLIIEQGDTESLEITAEENLMPYLETQIVGGDLRLGIKQFVNIQPTEEITFRLLVKNLNAIETSGLGNVKIGSFNADRLRIEISGSGKVTIDNLQAEDLNLEISGLGDIFLAGKVEEQRIELSGAGSYQAKGLESNMADVTISGTGNVVIWVLEKLDVELSGAGKVEYYGSPFLNSEISGIGQLISAGEK